MDLAMEGRKDTELPYASAVIVAAGSANRFGSDKLMANLAGKPVILRTLQAFQGVQAVQEIVLVVREDMLDRMAELCTKGGITKLSAMATGGRTRAQSCLKGVMCVSPQAELIAIHDGARPMVTDEIILDALWTAYRHTAAAPAVAVHDTVKIARDGMVVATPDRSTLFSVQTPQCFQADLIRAALENAVENNLAVTDDCRAVECIGGHVALSAGSEENMKITTPLDLRLAELIWKERTGV